MTKKLGKANNPKVLLRATATHKKTRVIVGEAAVYIGTYPERLDGDVVMHVSGFSTVPDKRDAFELRHVDDVIAEWLAINGKGWRIERCTTGGAPEMVVFDKGRRV
ncbi:MAG TPA: hypothetical protein VF183_07290 [Acidimicrobiales bacterium]